MTTPWTDEKRAAAIADLAPHFPQLEILELLGQGGMGAVYKARQKHLDRLIAIKVIPPEAAKEPAFAERFAREARALARLNHPNIVTVYDFGQSDGVYFLLMEFVDGLNLRQTMKSGNLSPQEALAIVPHVCDALQYAHDQGIVHRDVKPENVLLDKSGRVKIADFGLAKLLTQSPLDFTLTHSMQVMGTPRYMAPEQIEHPTEVDHRADIYSLGVMFYEMLTGELPMGRFAPPSQKVQIDIRIDEIVLRSLEKEPSRRYQKASEIRTELETVSSSQNVNLRQARTSSAIGATPNASKTNPVGFSADVPPGMMGRMLLIAGTLILSCLLVAVGLAIGIYAFDRHRSDNEFYGLLGAAFGCTVGGLGSLGGTWNTYRQWAGKEDWMESASRTWLDRAMFLYLLVAIVGLLSTSDLRLAALFNFNRQTAFFVAVTCGIMAGQAVLFLLYRATVGWSGATSSLASATQNDASARGISKRSSLSPEDEQIMAAGLEQMSGPGLGLMIAGFLGLVPCVLVVLGMIGLFFFQSSPQMGPVKSADYAAVGLVPILAQSDAPPMASTPVWFIVMPLVVSLLQIPSSFLMILGGRKMRRLETYGLAVLAGICALLPTGPVWIISMPVGIWALIVLASPEVRDAFRAKRGRKKVTQESPRPADSAAAPLPSKPVDE
jgi:tRNA A-37 threonylcarbamoyl transferase component Bud32